MINEPRAAALVHEAQREWSGRRLGCAFIAYEEAAKLLADTFRETGRRAWTAMKQDPKIVAEAETCSKVRECLHMFHTAGDPGTIVTRGCRGNVPERSSPARRPIPRSTGAPNEELAKLHGHGKQAKKS